jgi:hypothetical protein
MIENPSITMQPIDGGLRDGGFVKLRTAAIAAVAVLGLGVGARGVFGGGNEGGGNGTTATTTPVGGYDTDSGCDVFVDAQAATEGNLYDSKAFLPKFEKDDSNAKVVIDNLFNTNGPLSNKGDIDSLAAFMAVIGTPANDGKAVDPTFNHGEEFRRKVATYRSNGLNEARQDCAEAYDTAVQTAQYEQKWANEGDTVTLIEAIRDEDNNIIGMIPTKTVTGADLGGVSFEVRNTSDGVDGFTSVLYHEGDGKLFVKGITTGEGVKVIADSEDTVTVDPNSVTTLTVAPTVVTTGVTIEADPSTTTTSTIAPAESGNGEDDEDDNPATSNASPTPTVLPTNGGGGSGTGGNGGAGPTPSTPDVPGAGTTPVDVPATAGSTPATNGTPGTNGTPTSGTPNTEGPTTLPTTPPTEATPPPTQPTTPPTTATPTTPAPTTTQPTPTTVKGPQPNCVPNPPYVICANPAMAARYGAIVING